MKMRKMIAKVKKKLLRVTANRLINDAIYIGVNYALTGDVVNAFGGLSTMKVISSTAYVIFDEWELTPMKKALVWEAIITIIAVTINGLLTGDIMAALRITTAMKICIPVNYLYFRRFKK